MLRINELTKTYPNGVQALKGISLELPGGMFGLLGPNGAGKTTLMKIIATLLDPDSGTIVMNETDLLARKDRARQMLGYLPQEFGLYPTLTAAQTLHYFAKLKGVWNKKERTNLVGALLERVNLSAVGNQRVGSFSGGMRQRVGIAQALIGSPELIIVDEPTAGLDPEERLRFHNLLAESGAEKTVVILSTHIVSDVSSLCSQMAVIRQGKIVASGTPHEAVDQLKEAVWEATVSRDTIPRLKACCQVISTQFFGGSARVRVISRGTPPGPEFNPALPSLEDYYFDLMNQPSKQSALGAG